MSDNKTPLKSFKVTNPERTALIIADWSLAALLLVTLDVNEWAEWDVSRSPFLHRNGWPPKLRADYMRRAGPLSRAGSVCRDLGTSVKHTKNQLRDYIEKFHFDFDYMEKFHFKTE